MPTMGSIFSATCTASRNLGLSAGRLLEVHDERQEAPRLVLVDRKLRIAFQAPRGRDRDLLIDVDLARFERGRPGAASRASPGR